MPSIMGCTPACLHPLQHHLHPCPQHHSSLYSCSACTPQHNSYIPAPSTPRSTQLAPLPPYHNSLHPCSDTLEVSPQLSSPPSQNTACSYLDPCALRGPLMRPPPCPGASSHGTFPTSGCHPLRTQGSHLPGSISDSGDPSPQPQPTGHGSSRGSGCTTHNRLACWTVTCLHHCVEQGIGTQGRLPVCHMPLAPQAHPDTVNAMLQQYLHTSLGGLTSPSTEHA